MILAGMFAGVAWVVFWDYLLRAHNIPFLHRKREDRDRRRERLKQLGKLKYFVLFGVLGYGFAFALAMTVANGIRHAFSWTSELLELPFLAVLFGLIYFFQHWDEIRGPVPFPPNYQPPK